MTDTTTELAESHKCCICLKDIDKQYLPNGEMFWDGGHNPEPFPAAPGDRCCTSCNQFVVIPLRVARMFQGEEDE